MYMYKDKVREKINKKYTTNMKNQRCSHLHVERVSERKKKETIYNGTRIG